MNKTLLDSLVAGGLALALLFVILIDNLIGRGTPGPQSGTNTVPPPEAKPLRLAISQNVKFNRKDDVWDDMGHLLDNLGAPYNKYTNIPISELYNPKRYDDIDVLFLTCSQEGNDPGIADNVRQFVARGGTLYASDWRFKVLKMAFPDYCEKALEIDGDTQQLTADVVDAGLQDILGPKLPLKFDLDQWKPAAFKQSDRVKVLIKARYLRQGRSGYVEAPLLVKFKFEKGNVIFTSFHNEKQNSDIEKDLLKYLVFSAINADLENALHDKLVQGGFNPTKSSLLSASGTQEATYSYQSKKAGRVRFTLGFKNEGAELKMTVTTPGGKKVEQEGTSTFFIEEDGPVGEWRYSVRALKVPYANFSFNVQIAEKN